MSDADAKSSTLDPDFSVVLPLSAWNAALTILARAPFQEVASLVYAINGQLAPQLDAAVAKAQLAETEAAGRMVQ